MRADFWAKGGLFEPGYVFRTRPGRLLAVGCGWGFSSVKVSRCGEKGGDGGRSQIWTAPNVSAERRTEWFGGSQEN